MGDPTKDPTPPAPVPAPAEPELKDLPEPQPDHVPATPPTADPSSCFGPTGGVGSGDPFGPTP